MTVRRNTIGSSWKGAIAVPCYRFRAKVFKEYSSGIPTTAVYGTPEECLEEGTCPTYFTFKSTY